MVTTRTRTYTPRATAGIYTPRRLNFGPSGRPVKRRRVMRRPVLRRTRRNGLRSARLQIGENVGTGTSKTVTGAANDAELIASQTFDSNKQNFVEISTIQRGDALNARERGIVNSRGFKLDFMVANLATSNQTVFHYAVLSPKSGDTISPTDFFRSYNSDRARDFTATELTGIDGFANPINTDKYTIFKHGKIKLRQRSEVLGAGVGFQSYGMSGMVKRSIWIPTARQLRYEDTGIGSDCQTPLFLVWWCIDPMKLLANDVVADQMRFIYRVVHYFKEPKN